MSFVIQNMIQHNKWLDIKVTLKLELDTICYSSVTENAQFQTQYGMKLSLKLQYGIAIQRQMYDTKRNNQSLTPRINFKISIKAQLEWDTTSLGTGHGMCDWFLV